MQQLQPLLGVLYGFTGFVLERTTSPSETYDVDREGHRRQLLVAALATLYTAFLLFAAGATFILLSFVIYAPPRSCSSWPAASSAGSSSRLASRSSSSSRYPR
jgi:hypothetical protein